MGGIGVVLVEQEASGPASVREIATTVYDVFERAGIPSLDTRSKITAATNSLQNILAELGALYAALQEAPPGSTLTVVHDYEGVGAWLEGRWKTKNPIVAEVVAACRALIEARGLRVRFRHQRGHESTFAGRNDFAAYNARADKLATEAALRPRRSGRCEPPAAERPDSRLRVDASPLRANCMEVRRPDPKEGRMCFDQDSRPPITPIAGGATDARDFTLQSADGTRFARLRRARDAADGRRHAGAPGRARPPHLLQGAGAPLRGGRRRRRRHRLLRPHRQDGRPERRLRVPAPRGPDDARRPSRPTSRPASRYLRSKEGGHVRALFSVGFCFGGALSFHQAASGLGYAGVIGFYGWPLGLPRWPDRPKPIDAVSRFRSPVLAIYGGADPGIPRERGRGVRRRRWRGRASPTNPSPTTARRTASSTASRPSSRTTRPTPGDRVKGFVARNTQAA